jgi:hypothetical protein
MQLPLWEMLSQWISKPSKGDWKSQNSMAWGIPYIISKLLECRCLEWACITHLNIWNTSHGPKKGPGVKLWRAPKFFIRPKPKKGPTMLKGESSWNLVPLPASSTKGGWKGRAESSGVRLGRGITYLVTWSYIKTN